MPQVTMDPLPTLKETEVDCLKDVVYLTPKSDTRSTQILKHLSDRGLVRKSTKGYRATQLGFQVIQDLLQRIKSPLGSASHRYSE